MKRTARALLCALLIQALCNLKRIRVGLQHRIEARSLIDAPNAGQIKIHQLNRAELARRHQPLQACDGRLG